MDLDVLREAIDALESVDPSVLADEESVVTLHRQLSRLEAITTGATSAFERSGVWALHGARQVAVWLAVRCGLAKAEARRRVRLGRALLTVPLAERAWRAGEVTGAHVAKLTSLRTTWTADAFERDESLLVDKAKTLRFEDFTKVADYWAQHADPGGTEEAAEARRARRDVTLFPSAFGSWLGSINLDEVSGAIVSGELRRIEDALFEADRAEYHQREGAEATAGTELCRTAAQRRADALVEMATRSAGTRGEGRRPRPLFSVFVGYETLHGRILELAQGAALTPGSLVPWLTEADVERAVFTPEGRVEVSATNRFFTGATRRALELRDRQCTHRFCDRPAEECEADHITPWAEGGLTTQENGQLLCGYHNRLKNQRPPPQQE
jgi:hypothetical protein